MMNGLRTLCSLWKGTGVLALFLALSACGGGGSSGGGFLGEGSGSTNPLSIVTTALPQASQGINYTAVLEADGGTTPYNWSLINDGGTGLTIDTDGILSGVAPDGGEYGITVEVADARNNSDRLSLVLTVTGGDQQPLTIATETLPEASAGGVYSAVLQATGGQGTYMWTLLDDGGSGLDLRDDGVLSGTAPAQGDYGISVAVMDDTREVTKALVLTVTASGNPLTITTSSLPSALEGERYATVLNASGGSGDYSWTLVNSGGSGLSLSSFGVLSGVTDEVGTFGIVFRVRDGSSSVEGALTLTVESGEPFTPLAITTQSLPPAQGTLYAASLQAEGGTQPYFWTLVNDGGSGLTLSSAGALSGNSPAAGTYALTVRVVDSSGADDTAALTLVVEGADNPPVEILTNSLGTATYGQTYSRVLQASGGQSGDYTWTVIEVLPNVGPPPASPTIDTNTGVITWPACDINFDGDGDADGTTSYSITLQVTDAGPPESNATATIPLVAVDDPDQNVCP